MQYFAYTWPIFVYYTCVFNNSQNTAHSCFGLKNQSRVRAPPVLSNLKINYLPDYESKNQAKTVVLRFNAVSLQDISRSVSRRFANISAQEVTKIYFTEVLGQYSDSVPAEQYANFVLHNDDKIQLTNLTKQNYLKLREKTFIMRNNTAVRQNRNRKLFTKLQCFLQSVRRTIKIFLIKMINLDKKQI